MAEGTIGRNLTFPIKNADGTSFHGLSLKKATYNTVVMSLGDKITGDLYYPDNNLAVTMQEYIEYNDNGSDVKFFLVNPPTIVKERMASDNSELKGMTKYSFEFYHPMYMLGNFPFSDVAVTSNQQKYLSENKTFSWIGTLVDYVAKINKNLQNTEWIVVIGSSVAAEDKNKLSEVMPFDEQTIADALKKGYEIWKVPYVVDVVKQGETGYSSGKRFKVQFGLPTTEILVENGEHELVPYVFQCGQGVGLKNNSRTPRNNKIVTRISGYGSETNIPYGYPQIIWTGNQSWKYTINNDSTNPNSYPIYDGIVAGQRVKLIKHPFTRTVLMPSVYVDCVNKKVNPNATGYDPTIELKDYYDADNTYENPVILTAPSYEIHNFEDIKPELGEKMLVAVTPLSQQESKSDYQTLSAFLSWIEELSTQTNIDVERAVLHEMYNRIQTQSSWSDEADDGRQYWFKASFTKDNYYAYVKFESTNINFTATILLVNGIPTTEWDDTMDDDGNYVQSYFQVTLPTLDFDIYACAAVTEEMKIYMRSGDCLGCTFPVMVDWDDYKRNFYDEDGNFAPSGSQRDLTRYPNSENTQVTLTLQKETETFGTLMPNIYQQPQAGDKFVVLGISLPTSYITAAEQRLDDDMKQYMRDNNVYYFDYPLKFDEYFLATHTNILTQMKNNVVVRFNYAGTVYALYIKQMSVKFGQSPLPQYDITLTDDVEIVLNQIGQVSNEVSNLRVLMGQGGSGMFNDDRYLRKDVDDTARGFVRFMKGLQVGERFVTGLLGEGGVFRKEADGTTYIEADKLYIRMKAYFDTVEVRKYLHSGGNRIASPAGMTCTRVEFIDSNGNVTTVSNDAVAFKCYFRAQDDSRVITNDFVVGDLAFCKETNVDTDNIDQHGFWRLVTSTSSSANSDNEHWIMLSNRSSETLVIDGTQYTRNGYLNGSDIPLAYDDIIQLGNIADSTRQGAIVEFVSGADAPSYQIYQGINTFSLVGKNYVRFGYDSQYGGAQAYIGNPNGSSYLWYHVVNGTPQLDVKANVKFTSPYTQTETDLEAFAAAVKSNEDDLQAQIDGQIETWFYAYAPTLNNLPASGWSATDKKNHLGDLFYDTTTGYGYRFANTGTSQSPVYEWLRITDVDVVKALADAAEAQDTADHKRRVFLSTPYPPYDAGDLWVNAVWPSSGTSQGSTYNNDILRCLTSKGEDEAFSISDWGLASRYTDDTALQTFLSGTYLTDKNNIQDQIDGKAETWYQDTDPSSSWTTSELKEQHVGDLWYNTSANSHQTFIYNKNVSGSTVTYSWGEADVPVEVFDMIDGKSSIFTSRPSNYKKNDLWILASDMTINGTAYKRGEVLTATTDSATYYASHWTKKVSYTDDTTVNQIISNYGNILGITSPTAANVGQALGLLSGVLKSNTSIAGGLILTSLIAMRDSNNNVWGGISGTYQSSETDNSTYKGHGIAAWFGGVMVDKEVQTSASNYARSLFRFDGSGYVASGNISWDKTGTPSIRGNVVDASTFKIDGSTIDFTKYVTTDTAQTITGAKTFGTSNGSYIQIGGIRLVYDQTNNALKVVGSDGSTAANFYATGGVSAMGAGVSGGGGGGGMDASTMWNLLATNDSSHQIHSSHVSSALSGYATQSWVQQQIASGGTYLPLSGGTITGNLSVSGNITTNGDVAIGDSGSDSVALRGNDITIGSSGSNSVVVYGDSFLWGANTVATRSWVNTQDYMPKSGGTFTGSIFTSSSAYVVVGTSTGEQGKKLYVSGDAKVTGDLYMGSNKVATQSWVTSQGYLKSADLSSYMPKSGGTFTGSIFTSSSAYVVIGTSSGEQGKNLYVSGNAKVTGTLYIGSATAATQTWVQNQGYVSSLSGYATQTWVQNQGYVKSSGVTSISAGTGLSGGTITSTGTIALLQTVQDKIDHGESAYNNLSFYMQKIGGTFTGNVAIQGKLELTGSVYCGGYILAAQTWVSNNFMGLTSGIAKCTGIKLNSVCIESNEAGSALGSYTGEINRFGSTLHLQYSTAYAVTMCVGGGSVLVGTTSGEQGKKFYCQGNGRFIGSCTASSHPTSSDMRLKDVISYVNMSIEEIAAAPVFTYTWKNSADKTVFAGSSAQYWRYVLPQVVNEAQDDIHSLSMQYDVAALLSAVMIAKKVVDHERRIKELEEENERLRDEVEQLKAA